MEKSDPTVVTSRFVKINFDRLCGEIFLRSRFNPLNLLDDLSLIAIKTDWKKIGGFLYLGLETLLSSNRSCDSCSRR